MIENSQNASHELPGHAENSVSHDAPGAVGESAHAALQEHAATAEVAVETAGENAAPDSTEPVHAAVETAEGAAPDDAASEQQHDAASDASGKPESPAVVEEVVATKPKGRPRSRGDEPVEEIPVSNEPPKLQWYILKVQSNREDSIRDGLQRRVNMAGLDKFFGEIIVPIEMVSEFKGGKKRVVKRKLYPGYIVVHMEINEDTWFLVRETPGIGDFTGSAGKPTPMLPHEIQKIVSKQEEKTDEQPKLNIKFQSGDRVKINEGTFENFEGEVDSIDEASGRVTVMINIFGRSTPVELEFWAIEAI